MINSKLKGLILQGDIGFAISQKGFVWLGIIEDNFFTSLVDYDIFTKNGYVAIQDEYPFKNTYETLIDCEVIEDYLERTSGAMGDVFICKLTSNYMDKMNKYIDNFEKENSIKLDKIIADSFARELSELV